MDLEQSIGPWTMPWTPPKFSSKFIHNLQLTLQNVSLRSICMIMVKNPGKSSSIQENTDRHQNLIDSSLRPRRTLSQNFYKKSVHNFWRYFVHNKWLHTDRTIRTHLQYTISRAPTGSAVASEVL